MFTREKRGELSPQTPETSGQEKQRTFGQKVQEAIILVQEGKLGVPELVTSIKEMAKKIGIRESDVHIDTRTVNIGETGTVRITTKENAQKGNMPQKPSPIVLMAVMLNAACNTPKESEETSQETKTHEDSGDTSTDGGHTTTDTGLKDTETLPLGNPEDIIGSESGDIPCNPSPYFNPNAEYSHPKQIADITPPECGEKPEHAPDECGVQQWAGYSEHNPAAVSWMAIANTGDETCSVKITRLELSYKSTAGEKALLDCGINWSQRLSDGTQEEYGNWGTYISDSGSGTLFEIPPRTGAYIHPFGNLVLVPDDAQELTITFSAEITPGCVASGGMDTYSEFANPDKVGHDIIFEAMKTPWVAETIKPENPISYSIVHVPTKKD